MERRENNLRVEGNRLHDLRIGRLEVKNLSVGTTISRLFVCKKMHRVREDNPRTEPAGRSPNGSTYLSFQA
jgi:hypothetical protein